MLTMKAIMRLKITIKLNTQVSNKPGQKTKQHICKMHLFTFLIQEIGAECLFHDRLL